MGKLFFSYGSEHGYNEHKTEEEAKESAQSMIDDYRGDACDGWNEEVSTVCWGQVRESSVECDVRPRNAEDSVADYIKTICDYQLVANVD